MPKPEAVKPVREILRLRDIDMGVIDTGEHWVSVIEFTGIHFELLSLEEQRRVDDALLSLVAALDFPVKFWATNRPLGVSREVRRLASLAETWDGSPHAGIGDVCREIAAMLEQMSFADVPERHLYASVWVPRARAKQDAVEELDRRADQIRRAIQSAIPYSEPRVLGTGDVLRALHGFWLKNRHAAVSESLGERGETVLVVRAAAPDPTA